MAHEPLTEYEINHPVVRGIVGTLFSTGGPSPGAVAIVVATAIRRMAVARTLLEDVEKSGRLNDPELLAKIRAYINAR